jgi:hypothetical protein
VIKYHPLNNGKILAEILPETPLITEPGDILDMMADAGYNSCDTIMIRRETFHPAFFDLKTGMAGEILQKFSNYRMKLAIIGDYTDITSKSLKDFIRESNRRGTINFVDTIDHALDLFNR